MILTRICEGRKVEESGTEREAFMLREDSSVLDSLPCCQALNVAILAQMGGMVNEVYLVISSRAGVSVCLFCG